MLHKAHALQLRPTKAQQRLLHRSFGCARHSYNWALAKWKGLYEAGGNPNAYSLIKLQNSIKKEQMPFYLEVNKCAVQYAIHNVEAAYKKMWREGAGYPKFNKKGDKDSYVAVDNKNNFKQKDKKIWLPRIGWVKCHEDLRFDGKINNVVIKRVADKYFAVVNLISNETPIVCENQATVGVDLGVKTLLVCSDGTTFENPKTLKSNLKSLKRLQRGLSRKVKGSANRKKQQLKVAKKHYRVSCIRKNAIHEATSYLVNNYGRIVIEDLDVRALVKNSRLSQAISDAAFGEIKRQLAYKAMWQGVELVKADRYFASSKLCSKCGNKKSELKLSERVYNCECCGYTIDRDLNAAINLENYVPASSGELTPVEISVWKSLKQEIEYLRIEPTACHLKNL